MSQSLTTPAASFFGLLYLDQRHVGAANAALTSYEEQRTVYLKNAALLADSLRLAGHPFTLLTNAAQELRELDRRQVGAGLNIQEIPFQTVVPQGIRFYGAHYKLDVFRYFAAQTLPYVVLLDLDMVALRPFGPAFQHTVARGQPLAYDITDQLPGDHYLADLNRLNPGLRQAPWYGGEFLGGPPTFFAQLDRQIQQYFPAYAAGYRDFDHQGDETLTSAALAALRATGVVPEDAGRLGLVTRYWSVRPDHRQTPLTQQRETALWHLPSDKHFLATMPRPFDARLFERRFRSHLLRLWPRNTLKLLRPVRHLLSRR